MTPLQAKILMKCKLGDMDYSPNNGNLDIDELVAHEMIEKHLGLYIPTAKGHCLIDYICSLPYPVQEWIMPEKAS